ncbi:MAG: hypothetical protein QF464_24255 [Myxococcota bacterium]|nr:hypothetical protein [Myxococcota bacterium]
MGPAATRVHVEREEKSVILHDAPAVQTGPATSHHLQLGTSGIDATTEPIGPTHEEQPAQRVRVDRGLEGARARTHGASELTCHAGEPTRHGGVGLGTPRVKGCEDVCVSHPLATWRLGLR